MQESTGPDWASAVQ